MNFFRNRRIFLFHDRGGLVENDIRTAFLSLECPVETYTFQPKNIYNHQGHSIDGRDLFNRIESFQPDLVMGINGNCCDAEGVLSDYYREKGIPVAVWYVDKPYLKEFQGNRYRPENTAFFFIDRFYTRWLKQKQNYPFVYHLPLGTNLYTESIDAAAPYRQDLSFVGRSNLNKIERILSHLADKDADYLRKMAGWIDRVGQTYQETPLVDPYEMMNGSVLRAQGLPPYPDEEYEFLVNQLVEELVSHKKRAEILNTVASFNLRIFGDRRWKELLPEEIVIAPDDPTTEFPFSYGSVALQETYRQTRINLNITRYQVRTGVNQRVFDVPASGGFLLTDFREEIPELFEIDREIVCYNDPEEAHDKITYYLAHPEERNRILTAARKRILQEHTYPHRMDRLLQSVEAIRKEVHQTS